MTVVGSPKERRAAVEGILRGCRHAVITVGGRKLHVDILACGPTSARVHPWGWTGTLDLSIAEVQGAEPATRVASYETVRAISDVQRREEGSW